MRFLNSAGDEERVVAVCPLIKPAGDLTHVLAVLVLIVAKPCRSVARRSLPGDGLTILLENLAPRSLVFFAGDGTMLGLELPGDLVYLRLNGIFLLMLTAFYLLPVLDPRRYAGVVVVAVAGRFLGFSYLAGAWSAGLPAAFLALALGDLFFCLLHGLLLGLAGRSNRGKC